MMQDRVRTASSKAARQYAQQQLERLPDRLATADKGGQRYQLAAAAALPPSAKAVAKAKGGKAARRSAPAKKTAAKPTAGEQKQTAAKSRKPRAAAERSKAVSEAVRLEQVRVLSCRRVG